MPRLIAGAACVNITPHIGCSMAGYAGRDHGAVGIHDELYCRALYLDDGRTSIALVSNDLCMLGAQPVAEIRKLIEKSVAMPGQHVFVTCTHTHSGPSTGWGPDSANRAYMESLVEKIAGAVFWAREQAQPATVRWGEQQVRIGVNRRQRQPDGTIILGVNPRGPVSGHVDVVRVDDKRGRPIAILFVHACHAVVMGPSNYLVSGDFPGPAQQFVERNLGGADDGVVAMFMNGCCGDINAHPRESFDHVATLGTRLGAAAIMAASRAEDASRRTILSYASHSFKLPVEAPPSVARAKAEVAEARRALKKAEADKNADTRRWAVPKARWGVRTAQQRMEAAQSKRRKPALPTAVDVAALGHIALVGLPGEIFYTIGQEIRSRSPFRVTIPVGYANGSIGYVPTPDAYAEGGYEIGARARYKGLGILPEAAAALTDGALAALKAAALKLKRS